MTSSYRVLHGIFASAGQPGLLAKGLRETGIDAVSLCVGPNRLEYPVDIHIPATDAGSMRAIVSGLCPSFDILHLHGYPLFFSRGPVKLPMGLDILALKALGKRIVVHFRGTEARLASVFEAKNPYNYVHDDPDGLFQKYPEHAVSTYLAFWRALADEILVVDPELQTYVPEAKIMERAIDLDKWRHIGVSDRERPLVIHAPSRRGVKGTEYVLAAVETLRSSGVEFDFRLIEGLTNEAARELYREADIVIDQLRIGWYGVLAVEAMALGKAVVAYVREDLRRTFCAEEPVAVATPDSLINVLRELIVSPAKRRAIAAAGHAFCLSHHDAHAVARKCAGLYEEILSNPTKLDQEAYFEVLGIADEAVGTSNYLQRLFERFGLPTAFLTELQRAR